MTFVLRNDQWGTPVYLAGTADLPIGEGLVVSEIIFNANPFETREEAVAAAVDMPGDWTVSEIGEFGSSENLGGTS